jgi:hypothetical protein
LFRHLPRSCLGGERKSAEQLDSAPENTPSQPIALEPLIVREQPRGAHAPPYSTPATNTDTPLLENLSMNGKIITDFKSDPFILSYVEGFREDFSGDCF